MPSRWLWFQILQQSRRKGACGQVQSQRHPLLGQNSQSSGRMWRVRPPLSSKLTRADMTIRSGIPTKTYHPMMSKTSSWRTVSMTTIGRETDVRIVTSRAKTSEESKTTADSATAANKTSTSSLTEISKISVTPG